MKLDQDVHDGEVPRRPNLIAGAVSVAAILLFVGTGSAVLSQTLQHHFGGGRPADRTLVIALLLNVALILFGWRRHRELSEELQIRTAAEERAYQLASRDPLTAFLNRRSLAEEGAAMFVRARRRRRAMALLMLDLDHFKTINDRFGHQTGDEILIDFCAAVGEALPPDSLFGRMGGEEFAAVVSGIPALTVIDFADRIRTGFAEGNRLVGRGGSPTVSVGVAVGGARALIETLLADADGALYRAKEAGRDRVVAAKGSADRETASNLSVPALSPAHA